MKKITIAKTVVGLTTSVGVGAIIANIIKTTTPVPVGLIMKVCMFVGGTVLSGLVSDQATTYTDDKIDETVALVKDMVTKKEI